MKYKVGDKVRIMEDLVMGGNYGGSVAVDDMTDMAGSVVTIESVGAAFGYYIEEDPDDYCWTDEMFEPVEEMSAAEAIKLFGELCHEQDGCDGCPIKKSMVPLGVMKLEQSIQKRLLKFSSSGKPTMRTTMRKNRLRRNLLGMC